MEALKQASLTVPVVLHAWSGSAEMVQAISKSTAHAFFSLSGAITSMKAQRALAIVRDRGLPTRGAW